MTLAARVASQCGVTRLADITHLDVLGIPVFQAVRPWSRGLSVHQGKGLTRAQAAVGALMEAIELRFAEDFAAEPIVRAFDALAPGERAPMVGDFADDRGDCPGAWEPLAWVAARTWEDGVLWVPFDVVSLDLSRPGDARLARSSDGLACRFDADEAFAIGLLEVVERDAVARFLEASPVERMLARIDLGSVPFEWLASLRERLRAAEVFIAVHHAPSLVATAFVCELLEPGATALRGAVWGSGCDPCPETALLKAVLEAVQSRLTAISGARDDFLPERAAALRPSGTGFALPPPPSQTAIVWAALIEGLEAWVPTASAIASRLATRGYRRSARVDLSPSRGDVAVVKAFVPGLGSGARRRRNVDHP